MTAVLASSPSSYASEIDAYVHGEYRPVRSLHAFAARPPHWQPGRYHLYLSWASTSSHHAAILRGLLGLDTAVSMSFVDSLRDGRGWAFRSRTGADPVNGFTLLRQAYEATFPGYAGDVRVPLLWDRHSAVIVTDAAEAIIANLLARDTDDRLAHGMSVDAEIARLDRLFAGDLNAGAALTDQTRRCAFRQALVDLDRRLATRRHLVGADVSDADLRLWVRLARLDAGPNASGTIGPRLDDYANLWRWATELYSRPAFAENTEFCRFSAPFATLPPW